MTKQEKEIMNILCENAMHEMNEYFEKKGIKFFSDCDLKQLKSCKARYFIDDRYIILWSYNTMVCFIDKENDRCFDVLRLVYGYTNTSAQHIAKFYDKFSRELPCQPSFLRYY